MCVLCVVCCVCCVLCVQDFWWVSSRFLVGVFKILASPVDPPLRRTAGALDLDQFDLGQRVFRVRTIRLRPIRLRPIGLYSTWARENPMDFAGGGWGPRRVGPEGWGPEGWEAQNFALFCPFSRHFSLLGVLSFLVVFETPGPQTNVHVWSSRVGV